MTPPDMTLNDYFAGLAMQALIANSDPDDPFPHLFDQISGLAYAYASSMLGERELQNSVDTENTDTD